MRRAHLRNMLYSLAVLVTVSWFAVGQQKPESPAPIESPIIIPVQRSVQDPDSIQQPLTNTPVAPSAPVAPPTPPPTTAPVAQASGSSSTVPISAPDGASQVTAPAGAQSPASSLNATDLGGLLSKSDSAGGVEVQRRNAIVNDPRIRGLRNGQFYSVGDGAPYFPGRIDLDTPISKFDPSMIRDVNIIRGPYTSLLGPAFSFLDISTLNTPRSKNGCGPEFHGMTSAGYQTNGSQWNGLQSVSMAGQDWGFRGSYNILQGNDFKAGDGTRIPASYLSNNFNVAFGYDITSNLSIEFKGLRSVQNNLEFPGLYFDIDRSDSEAYSVRLVATDFGPFNRLTTDVWYNGTASSGSTRAGAKQTFVNNLIKFSFAEPNATRDPITGLISDTQNYQFRDNSTTRFAERSIGYRFAGQLGNNKDQMTFTLGTDLNAFGQGLQENIQFTQLSGPPTLVRHEPGSTNAAGQTVLTQSQSIPNSNSINPGLFVEAMLPVTEALKLKSGGRIDYVRTSSNSRLITGNIDLFGQPQSPQNTTNRFAVDPIIYSTDPRQTSLDREFTLLAGFLTAEYKLSKETTLFLGYGYAERAPTLTELYTAGPLLGVLQQGLARTIGDPNLSKERLNQFDVGLRYNSEYLNAGITGYYALINDYITFDANRISPLGLSQIVYTNTDLATLAGTEMYLQTNVTKWLSPFATLSYVQGVDQTHVDNRRNAVQPDGIRLNSSRRDDPATRSTATQTEALQQIPPMETRLGFRLHGTDDIPRWQVELSARIVTGQNSVATSLGEINTPGFTTFDIRAFWQLHKNLLLTGGVENIGNKLYREHLDPVAANLLTARTGVVVPQLYRPGTNFFFRTELRY